MNTENNSRYQETDKKILQAFTELAVQKTADSITVTDICTRAGIHRTSFYRHYTDVSDLRERMFFKQLEDMLLQLKNNGREIDIRNIITEQLLFYKRHRKIIRKDLESKDVSDIIAKLTNTAAYSENYDRAFHLTTGTEKRYHRLFFQTGYTAVVTDWLKNGCREPEEEIADLLCRFLIGSAR